MLNITLPDGNKLSFEKKVTGLEVAEKISKSLSKSALLISIDGKLKDLDTIIDKDCSIKIFTSKDKEGIETIRHDTAHILAMAVQELFPGTQVTIGPVIDNGFYYDFARKEPFTDEDLKKIENKDKLKNISGEDVNLIDVNGYSRGQQAIDYVYRVKSYYNLLAAHSCTKPKDQLTFF